MKLKSKTIFLVISMLILSLVTGSVAPLAAPAEASTAVTINGQAVETRHVGAVRGRGGTELARASALERALERTGTTAALPVAGPAASVEITPGTMLIRHADRELFILADSRNAFLTTGVGNPAGHATNPLRTTNVTLSVLPRTVGGRELFVPFNDVIRHLNGSFTAARTATLTAAAPASAFAFDGAVLANARNVVTATANAIRFVGRGATFPDSLYGRAVTPGVIVTTPAAVAPWIHAYFHASDDLRTTPGAAQGTFVGYNRINLDSTTASALFIGATTFGAIVGSGVGVDAVRLRQADFGGTDMITQVPPDVREAFPPIPTVKGGVAVVYNVVDRNGRRIGHLNFTADTIARIYLGQITHWNNAELVRLNPGVALPNEPIRVNWRPDVSGTTEIFTAYLNAASDVWRETLTGTDALVRARTTADLDDVVRANVGGWTAADFTDNTLRRTQTAAGAAASPAAIAAEGGTELRHRVRGDRRGFSPNFATDAAAAPAALNSIGYIAYGGLVGHSFTADAGGAAPMVGSVARVRNRAGIFVLPLINNVYAAGLGHGDILAHPVNGANPGAYPITGLTWIMVERNPAAAKAAGTSVQVPGPTPPPITIPELPARASNHVDVIAQLRRNAVVVDFIRWAVVEGFGDRQTRELHMAPLTPAMRREAARILDTIQVSN